VELTVVSISWTIAFTMFRSFKSVWTSAAVNLVTVAVAAGTMTETACSTAPMIMLRLDWTAGRMEFLTSVTVVLARD
jgi:hypothetical protein